MVSRALLPLALVASCWPPLTVRDCVAARRSGCSARMPLALTLGDELDVMERGLSPSKARAVTQALHPQWLESRHGSHVMEREREEVLADVRNKPSGTLDSEQNRLLQVTWLSLC